MTRRESILSALILVAGLALAGAILAGAVRDARRWVGITHGGR